jgi:hypothetical protein
VELRRIYPKQKERAALEGVLTSFQVVDGSFKSIRLEDFQGRVLEITSDYGGLIILERKPEPKFIAKVGEHPINVGTFYASEEEAVKHARLFCEQFGIDEWAHKPAGEEVAE